MYIIISPFYVNPLAMCLFEALRPTEVRVWLLVGFFVGCLLTFFTFLALYFEGYAHVFKSSVAIMCIPIYPITIFLNGIFIIVSYLVTSDSFSDGKTDLRSKQFFFLSVVTWNLKIRSYPVDPSA